MQETQETQVLSLGQEDPPGVRNGNALPYSCLENSMDRGAWQAIVHGIVKSQARLSKHTHTQVCISFNKKIIFPIKSAPKASDTKKRILILKSRNLRNVIFERDCNECISEK